MIESFKRPRRYQIDFCRLLKIDALLETSPRPSLSLPFPSTESLMRHPGKRPSLRASIEYKEMHPAHILATSRAQRSLAGFTFCEPGWLYGWGHSPSED